MGKVGVVKQKNRNVHSKNAFFLNSCFFHKLTYKLFFSDFNWTLKLLILRYQLNLRATEEVAEGCIATLQR